MTRPAHNLRPAVARKLAKALRDYDLAAIVKIRKRLSVENRYGFAALWGHESVALVQRRAVADLLDPPKPPAKRARRRK